MFTGNGGRSFLKLLAGRRARKKNLHIFFMGDWFRIRSPSDRSVSDQPTQAYRAAHGPCWKSPLPSSASLWPPPSPALRSPRGHRLRRPHCLRAGHRKAKVAGLVEEMVKGPTIWRGTPSAADSDWAGGGGQAPPTRSSACQEKIRRVPWNASNGPIRGIMSFSSTLDGNLGQISRAMRSNYFISSVG
jgi:hypothetical protein